MRLMSCVITAACVVAVSFDKVRAFDLDTAPSQGQTSQGQIRAVREQLMTEDTKDVEPLVHDSCFLIFCSKIDRICLVLICHVIQSVTAVMKSTLFCCTKTVYAFMFV